MMNRAGLSRLLLLWGITFVAPVAVMAHGTSEPGPHGGEIRMPGAFHVEAVVGDQSLRLYLLDMQFKNPMVSDSSADAKLRKKGGSTVSLNCTARSDVKAFVCALPDGVCLKRGTLIVDASRNGMPASAARYELPLAWSGE